MDQTVSTDTRHGRIHLDFDSGKVLFRAMTGSDYMNDLFDYQVEVICPDPNIDFEQAIGTKAGLEFKADAYDTRVFNGIITEAQRVSLEEEGAVYRFRLQPWLWLADQGQNQRIFHNMDASEIISEVLNAWGDICEAPFSLKLFEDYPKLEYTVQYQESDLAFVRRLMEQFGMSFFFRHELDKHELCIVDDETMLDKIPGETRKLIHRAGRAHIEGEHFWNWQTQRYFSGSSVRMTDYNFATPNAAMVTDHSEDSTSLESSIDSYQYPGDYPDQGLGNRISRIRARQGRSSSQRCTAQGNVMSLTSGMTVQLDAEQDEGTSDEAYICVAAYHRYTGESYRTGGGGADAGFEGHYVFAPPSTSFAPKRLTPKPRIYGPQTARVVGEGEIDCDDLGRILVLFPWDLEKAHSMRCRVSQLSAGSGWGMMVIPRIGMEVVVEFIGGDPDKPLVTGCVYNGDNSPPYGLPGSKSQSGFLSQTHEGAGSNELRFEDQSGSQQIYLHAEKDYDSKVKNNMTLTVDVDQTVAIGSNQSITVGTDRSLTVGANHTVTTGTNHTETIGSNRSETIGASDTLNVAAAKTVTVGAAHTRNVGGSDTLAVAGGRTVGVAGALSVAAKSITQAAAKAFKVMAKDVDIDGANSTKIGSKDIEIKGKNITLDASSKITIKVGGSKVTISKSSIVMKSSKISQN